MTTSLSAPGDTLTTATAVYTRENRGGGYVARIIVATDRPGIVRKATQALNYQDATVTQIRSDGDTYVDIDLGEIYIREVAQAAAEGIARAIGHVIPTLA